MNKVCVNMENCYGIPKLQYDFEFDNGRTIIIYAPNGAMKTSFAQVFRDLINDEQPSDRYFPKRKTSCSILDEKKKPLEPKQILVINPHVDNYRTEKMATLLVNDELKRKYEFIHKEIEKAHEALFKQLGKVSGLRNAAEAELVADFKTNEKELHSLLEKLENDVKGDIDKDWADIKYHEVFNEKTKGFLESQEFRKLLKDYIEKYNEIIEQSPYFRKGGFGPYNATTVGTSLKNQNFFSAKHTVTLKDRENQKVQEIGTPEKFMEVIEQEEQRILNTDEVKEKYRSIDKELNQHADLRKFKEYIKDNQKLLPELIDQNTLKLKLWRAYLSANKDLYIALLTTYRNGKGEIEKIVEKANQEVTEWQEVVAEFNNRFKVPFILDVGNKSDVVLGIEAPSLVFKCIEGTDCQLIDEEELMKALSTGEQRAFYILHLIFEVRARSKAGIHTLLILDDIADSFDYKNKYAIIEYLKDIQEMGTFNLIILTHNFDFFRTVHSRLQIKKEKCLMGYRTETMINLTLAPDMNPFLEWKKQLDKNKMALVATIPMVRNLIEYTNGTDNTEYKKLTALLHQMNDTDSITIRDLARIFEKSIGSKPIESDDTVLPLIFQQADECLMQPDNGNLENKIVLSIAIRLIAERAMIINISEPTTDNIQANQTIELFKKYKGKFEKDHEDIKLLERVLLMTPEIIHLNSFMYEPIIDLSNDHLKKLYKDINDFAERA